MGNAVLISHVVEICFTVHMFIGSLFLSEQNTKLIKDEVLILIVFCLVVIDLVILLIYMGIYFLQCLCMYIYTSKLKIIMWNIGMA